MSEASPTVVFDFDLTLTQWDTADRFFRWLLKRQSWRLLIVLALAPVLAPLLLFQSTRKFPVRYAVWLATLGVSEKHLQQLVQEHADELFRGSAPVFLQEGLQRLQAHLEQGHRVVIATGCLEVLAKELLDRAGYAHVPLVGSTLQPYLGGMARREHCFGPNKIPMLSRRGFAPPWAFTYNDHQCDLPVLKLSTERFLINPRPEAVRLIRRELACDTTILTWR